jgi:glycosyltransferase involved in cell wall biosynthesis
LKPKALVVASVASMIQQFNMHNIQLLLDQGYIVDVVCNCKEGNTISDEKVKEMVRELAEKGVSVTHVPIPRKIYDIKGIFKSIKQIRKMCKKEKYALMHCQSPIGSVVARAAAIKARKNGMKVIYTAHGFHFYKGAPKKNWIIFYQIEKVFSYVTDVLITINKEDYTFAKKHMNAKQVEYLPGVGIDTEKFWLENFDEETKRAELGITKNDLMILSVGELNKNKNQEVIIRAIAKLNDSRIHYFIAGRGDKEEYLRNLAKSLGVNLQLLGYRTDIIELLNTADIFALPSLREGLSVALMEAMSAGLPCIVSRIRGNVDLIEEGKGGYLCEPDDVDGFKNRIGELMFKSKKKTEFSKFNRERITFFDIKEINDKMKLIYFCK